MESWTCPKCKRKFAKKNQMHSCIVYPVANHFKNKPKAKILYNDFKAKVKKIGKFRVDSPRCCIHFVKKFTFAGTYVMKDKLRIFFALDRKIKSLRIVRSAKISANKYTYNVDVKDKKEIDKELMNWIKESYKLV